MAGTNDEPEVKDVDRVEITPAGESEETIDAEETAPESSQEETEGETKPDEESPEGDESEGKGKPDQLVTRPKPEVAEPVANAEGEATGDIADVPGETPRERALRFEVTRLKGKLRGEQTADILGTPKGTGQNQPRELSAEEKAVIGKYKPEEIGALKEVIPVLAKEMGFVRKDEIQGSAYAEKSQDILDQFLEKHPEYSSENDKDGSLWNAFRTEYQTYYKEPANPKDFTKIFERIHRNVFGIKPVGSKTTINAQQEKTKVVSHTGASSTPAAPRAKPATAKASGLRLDMLKGFSDDEKDEMGEDE